MKKLIFQTDETIIEMELDEYHDSELYAWIDCFQRGMQAITFNRKCILDGLKEHREVEMEEDEDRLREEIKEFYQSNPKFFEELGK